MLQAAVFFIYYMQHCTKIDNKYIKFNLYVMQLHTNICEHQIYCFSYFLLLTYHRTRKNVTRPKLFNSCHQFVLCYRGLILLLGSFWV